MKDMFKTFLKYTFIDIKQLLNKFIKLLGGFTQEDISLINKANEKKINILNNNLIKEKENFENSMGYLSSSYENISRQLLLAIHKIELKPYQTDEKEIDCNIRNITYVIEDNINHFKLDRNKDMYIKQLMPKLEEMRSSEYKIAQFKKFSDYINKQKEIIK